MPFKSEAQRRFLWARHPKIAKKWAKEEKEKSSKVQVKGSGRARGYTREML
jgi:hypothetical protein